MEKSFLIKREDILIWISDIFNKKGLPHKDVEVISKALVQTSLWGIDSHGIARVPHYIERFETKSIKTNPDVSFLETGNATGQIDGDDGHGIVVMEKATKQAIAMAQSNGAAVIGVKKSSHCGAIGLYTRQITKAGLIGIAFTHSDSLVIPYGGKKAFFGTNPISIAFPTLNMEEPICLDMATSIVPWNFIMNARRDKKTIEKGLGVDIYGNEITNADNIVAVKPMADYKGFALAFLIDMLCGPLNGMNYGPNITAMYNDLDKKRGLGSLVIAIDPERFGGKENLKFVATEMINHLKKQNNNILFPGEPEYIKNTERLIKGIPISAELAKEFMYWSNKLNIAAPSYI